MPRARSFGPDEPGAPACKSETHGEMALHSHMPFWSRPLRAGLTWERRGEVTSDWSLVDGWFLKRLGEMRETNAYPGTGEIRGGGVLFLVRNAHRCADCRRCHRSRYSPLHAPLLSSLSRPPSAVYRPRPNDASVAWVKSLGSHDLICLSSQSPTGGHQMKKYAVQFWLRLCFHVLTLPSP